MTLEADPNVRLLVVKSDDAPMSGGKWLDGVYLFRNARGRVIYVGKAQNLKSRVRSYFRAGGDGRPGELSRDSSAPERSSGPWNGDRGAEDRPPSQPA